MTTDAPVNFDHGSALCCPACNEAYLHHWHASVFDRTEDAPLVFRVEVMTQGEGPVGRDEIKHRTAVRAEVVPAEGSGNPSRRRHGITISFWCELCDCHPVLCISQHKGMTLVEWAE